jgi:integrase/recombinase XerD
MKTTQIVEPFLNSAAARSLSFLTVAGYRSMLERFARHCPELPEKPGSIESFLAGLTGSPQTKLSYFGLLRSLFNFAHERYSLPNAMASLKAPRCPKKKMPTLEPEEALKFLTSATSLRDRTLLTLLLDTGVRSSEARTLRQNGIKTSTVVVQGKCGQREVPISEQTRRLLLSLIDQDGQHEYVFQGYKSRPLSRQAIYNIVKQHMIRAGIAGPKLGAHRLRHTFGKTYLVAGGDLRSLQGILGHANLSSTETYTSLNQSDIITKHHQFTPLRVIQGAAQASFFSDAVRQAEQVIADK